MGWVSPSSQYHAAGIEGEERNFFSIENVFKHISFTDGGAGIYGAPNQNAPMELP